MGNTLNKNAFHNDTLQRFNDTIFLGILSLDDVVSKKKAITVDKEKYYGYFVEKNKTSYFIPDFDDTEKSILDEFPIKVTKKFETDYNKAVFYFISKYKSVKIPVEQRINFKTLVDSIGNFKHKNPMHWLLYKIITIVGKIDRVNYRVISELGFGKDSVINNISDLVGNVANIYGATYAKLEYSLKHDFLIFNEMGGLKGDDKSNMQIFLLATGAYANKYLKRSRACYDENTRVLTKEGLKYHREIKPEEEILTINPFTRVVRWDVPNSLLEYDVIDADMVGFYNTHGVDMLVTPNHKICDYSYETEKHRETTAEHFLDKSRAVFDNSVIWDSCDKETITITGVNKTTHKCQGTNNISYNMDNFLNFVGRIISEGHISKDGHHFGLGQVGTDNANEFEEVLKLLGINYSRKLQIDRRENNQNIWRFNFSDKHLNSWCVNNIGTCSKDKKIPDEFRNLSKRQLKILFNSLMKGDGTYDTRGESTSCSYSTISKELAENVQEIGMKLGYNTSIISNLPKNRKNEQYRVQMNKRTKKTINKKDISLNKYTGKVSCFNTNDGYYVTERNGKLSFQGNTEDTQEEYDISKTSLGIIYNPPKYYIKKGQEYFDQMFTPAVLSRFIPFYLTGKLDEEFDSEFDVDAVMKENITLYQNIISTLLYYKEQPVQTNLTLPSEIKFTHKERRFQRSFLKICDYIGEYCEDDQEKFTEMVLELYSTHKKYKKVSNEAKLLLGDTE